MSTAPKSVAFIVNSLRFGGAEKHTLQLFNGLSVRGFRTALVYLKREEHLLHEADPASGLVWCAEFLQGWDLAGLRRLAAWIKNERPAVLVCVNTYPLFYGHLARLLAGHRCRVIAIFHSTELPKREDRKMRWVYRPFFNRCDNIVYVSTAQKAYWENRGLRKGLGLVIHNGIDSERFNEFFTGNNAFSLREHFGFESGDFVIGICAALRPEKKHEDLIEAVARLRAEGVPAKCLIIGDGPRRPAIDAAIARLKLEMDVAVTGFQADVRPYVAACDCIAIVSHQETFSIAALEAMSMGKPMVMSAIGGAAEQVTDGENGYLFPAGDVASLTVSLRKLANREHCVALGEHARLMVTRSFSIDRMLEKYEQLFSSNADAGICA